MASYILSLGQFVHMMKRQVTMHMCVYVRVHCSRERERESRETQKHTRAMRLVLSDTLSSLPQFIVQVTRQCRIKERKQTTFNNRSYCVTLQACGNRKEGELWPFLQLTTLL